MIDENSILDLKKDIIFHLFDNNLIANHKVHEALEILQKHLLNLIDFVERSYDKKFQLFELLNQIVKEDINFETNLTNLLYCLHKLKLDECETLILLDSLINEKIENQEYKITVEKQIEILNKEIYNLNNIFEEKKLLINEIYEKCKENDFNSLKFNLAIRKKDEEINLIILLGSLINYNLMDNPNILRIFFHNFEEVKSKMKMINLSKLKNEKLNEIKDAINNNFIRNLINNPNSYFIGEFRYLLNFATWSKLQLEISYNYNEIREKNYIYNRKIKELNQMKELEHFFMNLKFFNFFNSDICKENEEIKSLLQGTKAFLKELSDYRYTKFELELPSKKLFFLELNLILSNENKCILNLYSRLNSQYDPRFSRIDIGQSYKQQNNLYYGLNICGIIHCLGANK